MTSIKSITLALVVAATSMTALAPMADAAGLPNLKPGFNTKTGKLTVKNTGLAKSGKFVATISCSASGGGSCPDPTPAQSHRPCQNAELGTGPVYADGLCRRRPAGQGK